MAKRVITAHAPLLVPEAEALVLAWFDRSGLELAYCEGTLLIAWVDDAIDPGDEGFPGGSDLVVEVQIHSLDAAAVQVRWRILEGNGPAEAGLAAQIAADLLGTLAADGRWVVDGQDTATGR